MVPYQLGAGEKPARIKFKAQPCGFDERLKYEHESKFYREPYIPKDADPNFLRKVLKSTLDVGSPCMEFLIQVGDESQSVEDAKTEWPADKYRFVKVATLEFPSPQNFDTEKQNLACEDMSFSPWHALPEHKPLGALNRIRKVVYERISAFRQKSNHASMEEPPLLHAEQCVDNQWLTPLSYGR